MQCEKYRELRDQQRRLYEAHRISRQLISKPDEPLGDWVKQGLSEEAYDEILHDGQAMKIAMAFEESLGVPDDNGNFAVEARANQKAQREIAKKIEQHLLDCQLTHS